MWCPLRPLVYAGSSAATYAALAAPREGKHSLCTGAPPPAQVKPQAVWWGGHGGRGNVGQVQVLPRLEGQAGKDYHDRIILKPGKITRKRGC